MIDLVWKKNIQRFLEIRLYVIPFRFVRDGTWQLSVRQLQPTTDRKRWAIMQHKNFTVVYRKIFPAVAKMQKCKFLN